MKQKYIPLPLNKEDLNNLLTKDSKINSYDYYSFQAMAPRSSSSEGTLVPEPETFKPTSDGSQGAVEWLRGKAKDDNIGPGKWRVHNKLYDLKEFAARHPGGKQVLQVQQY